MPVPTRFPKEPRATERCGDSYLFFDVVTGELPGSDFGSDLKYDLKPLFFRGGSTKIPPLFENRADLDRELEGSEGLVSRIYQAAEDLGRNAEDFSEEEASSLRWLIDEIYALVQLAAADADAIVLPALPGAEQGDVGGHRAQAQARVEDALRHLRCAEYWIHRVILVRQATRERPLGFTPIIPTAPVIIYDTPPLDSLPPHRMPPTKRSYIPYVAAGAGTLLITGIVYYAVGQA